MDVVDDVALLVESSLQSRSVGLDLLELFAEIFNSF